MRGFGDQPQGCEIDGVHGRLRTGKRGSVYRLADARIVRRTVERSELDAAVHKFQDEMLATNTGVLA